MGASDASPRSSKPKCEASPPQGKAMREGGLALREQVPIASPRAAPPHDATAAEVHSPLGATAIAHALCAHDARHAAANYLRPRSDVLESHAGMSRRVPGLRPRVLRSPSDGRVAAPSRGMDRLGGHRFWFSFEFPSSQRFPPLGTRVPEFREPTGTGN